MLGGYFSHEYSLEAAALFNPSMVPHADQSNVPPGSLRFVLSLRATAEGHVSSIVFRSGMLDENSVITMDVPSRYSLEPTQVPNSTFEKPLFERKLNELRLLGDFNREVLNGLPDAFTMEELRDSIARTSSQLPDGQQDTARSVARETLMLAGSNYEVQFAPESILSERVFSRSLRRKAMASRMLALSISTTKTGRISTMRLIPRMMAGSSCRNFSTVRFPALQIHHPERPGRRKQRHGAIPSKDRRTLCHAGRQDAENIYVMFSDHLHFWNKMQLILEPAFPWEFIQMGNCGSPIETDAGWLVISHGVGPMRNTVSAPSCSTGKTPRK